MKLLDSKLIVSLVIATSAISSGCSRAKMQWNFGSNSGISGQAVDPTPLVTPSSSPSSRPSSGPSPQPSGTVLKKYKAALAVRGMQCLICHAQIQSNIITDFGYGNPEFFVNHLSATEYNYGETDGNQFNDSSPLTDPWYGNNFGSWQLAAQITGTIYVPQVNLTDSRLLSSIGATGSITLAQLLQTSTPAGFYADDPTSGSGSMVQMVTPPAGQSAVTEVGQIYIGAPTQGEILALKANPTDLSTSVGAIGPGSTISGLSVRNGLGGSYITNTDTVVCKGDVVVTGTLFLNNATIDTDNNGCRFLVTQSAFIQGQVLYTDTSGTQNLQISSARAVILGFDIPSLQYRLQGTNWYNDNAPLTRYPGTNSQKNTAIVGEALVIGSDLHDSTDAANCPTQMITYEAHNGSYVTTLTQCGIDYQRLMLNAPDIESRYVGQFKGAAIAEIALFAPGALDFAYDPVFDSVPLQPAIAPILSVPGLTDQTN